MATKTEIVRARVNPRTKIGAERVLKPLGLTVSEAINLLLVQIQLRKALPFEISMPNKETKKTLEDADKGIGLVKCKDRDDLFKQLGI